MNENNHFQNKNDRSPSDSLWSRIVERCGRENSENSDEIQHVEQVDLTDEQLDDLELDRQLRMLAKISDPDDSFVRNITAQKVSESDPSQSGRGRLSVVEPTFDTKTSEAVSQDESATESISKPETSEAIAQAESATATNQTVNDSVQSHPSITPVAPRFRGPLPSVVRWGSLVAALVICCFVGRTWWLDANLKVSDTQNPDTVATQDVQVAYDQPGSIGEESPEIARENGGDSNRLTTDDNNDAYVEHSNEPDSKLASNPDPLRVDSSDDQPKIASSAVEPLNIDPPSGRDPLSDLIEEIDDSIAVSNPTLADVEIDLPSFETEKVLKDPEDVPDLEAREWDSKFKWNLAIQFGPSGLGTVTLNDESIKAIMLRDNAGFLLRQIAVELKRRVQFLENRLDGPMSGSVRVGMANFPFEHISKLDETIEKVDQHIAGLDIRSLGVDELMALRVRYREGIFDSRNNFDEIDLSNPNLSFYTEDEAYTICSVLSVSESILCNLAKKRLVWEKNVGFQPVESDLVNRISPKAFGVFVKNGKLPLPDPEFLDHSIVRIQNLGPSALRLALQDAPSIELFRNDIEFQQAKDFVYSNGPPEMKLRLSIDKIDRLLESRDILKTEETEATLNEKKSRLARQLLNEKKSRLARQLRTMGVGIPKDAPAIQPLNDLLAKRIDLHGLPLAMGKSCQSDTDEIRDLSHVASSLGRMIARFNGSLGSRDAAQNDAFRNLSIKQAVSYCMEDHLRDRMGNRMGDPSSQKLKTIDQILQIDHPRLRLDYIEALRESDSKTAIKLIVNKAKFDLVPQVRIAATEALADFAPAEYRQLLLEGIKYPWHVVAEHSAEALVRLNDQEAIPELVEMLELPHPHFPIDVGGELVQRELVGINHLRNCLLCHAPSISTSDSARGLIPHASRPLPPEYYGSGGGRDLVPFAVRADITYLEQDFSVVLPIKDPGPWPGEQRIDFVVQNKKLTPIQASNAVLKISQSPNRNRNAVVYALRKLTGQSPVDNSYRNWKKIVTDRQDHAGGSDSK